MSIVDETWAELGRQVRPLGRIIFVRTEQLKMRTDGGIYLPASEQTFYDGPMHLRLVTATVLAAGPKADPDLKPGTRVCFQRRFFARWQALEDQTMVGWVDDSQITGICEPDTVVGRILEPVGQGARYATATPL